MATRQRTSIPLRSILNVEEVLDSAKELPPTTLTSKIEACTAKQAVVPSSQFLFINTHDTSRRQARLRQDQKVINAHVQHTSRRKRRAAATDSLKHTFRLCAQCAQSIPRSRITAPECSASPSSLASGSSPTSARVSDGPAQWPQPKGWHNNVVCSKCGMGLQSHATSHAAYDVRKTAIGRVSLTTSVLASAREQAAPLTPVVEAHPTSFLDSSMVDPFATSSVPINMEMNRVLLHFINRVVGGLYPVRCEAVAQTEFSVQICLAEPSALYAVLAVGSTDLEARTGCLSDNLVGSVPSQGDLLQRKMPAFKDYKLKAIRAVNEKITSTGKTAEVTIMVVLMSLMVIESITGNETELSRHVNEWQRLITIRGGYQGLPTCVTSAAVPASYMFATMTRSFPMSTPASPLVAAPESTCERIASNTDPQLQQIGTRFFAPDMANLFHETLIHTFHDLREVILYREYFHNQECVLPESEVEYFRVKSYKTLYRALSIPFHFPKTMSPQQDPCRLALLVFWYANYGIHLPGSGMLRSLTIQLKSALEQSDPQVLWQPHYSLFIWVTFLGAYISVAQREHSWFMMYLARAARELGFKSSQDLKAVLQPFFYIDRVYRRGLERIWEEASILKDAL